MGHRWFLKDHSWRVYQQRVSLSSTIDVSTVVRNCVKDLKFTIFVSDITSNVTFLILVLLHFWFHFRFAVGISAYGIHFSSKFVNFNIFGVAAIKEATAFVIILLIVPFFKMVSDWFMIIVMEGLFYYFAITYFISICISYFYRENVYHQYYACIGLQEY